MSCNKYTNMHEPFRADNRTFTDYRSNHILNDEIEKYLNTNKKEYKNTLTQNADKVFELFNKNNFLKNGTYNCK